MKDTTRKAVNTPKRKWNEYYDWLFSYVPPPIRVHPMMNTYQLAIDIIDTHGHNFLKGSALRNNKTMNNNNTTYILDEPVPHIGVETLRPTPFRRRIQSLKETRRKVVNKVKKKMKRLL